MQNFTAISGGGYEEDDQGYGGSDGSGTPLYEQVITTSGAGAISAAISGQGSVNGDNSAAITLDAGALAKIDGSSNMISLGDESSVTLGANAFFNTLTVSGGSATITDNGSGTSVTLSGTETSAYIGGMDTSPGTDTLSGTAAFLELGSPSSNSIVFNSGASGTVKLDYAQGFSGTVAGLADGDSIDLGNFLFSGAPTISNVTVTGAANTNTILTITDGGINTQIALLNQYANQFAVNNTAYALTADSTAGNAGTLLQLAAAH